MAFSKSHAWFATLVALANFFNCSCCNLNKNQIRVLPKKTFFSTASSCFLHPAIQLFKQYRKS